MTLLGSHFSFLFSQLWNSPDETSQAFFIKLFASHGSFAYPEPLNFVTNNLVHPRSTVVIDGFITPGGFIGLPLFYGSLFKVFGGAVLWFATPILTLLALFAFFRLVSVVWSRPIAWIATIAFASHPAVIYYTARGLFPNMVFLDLLILGGMFLITRPLKEIASLRSQWLRGDDLLGAACMGGALLVRFSEIIWVAPLWVALAFVGRKTISWHRVAIWVVVLAVFFSILTTVNSSLYGKPWSFGYTVNGSDEGSSWILEEQIDQNTLQWARGPLALIFPFGFHPFRAARIAATYAYRIYPLFAALAVFGFFVWLRGPRIRRQKIFVWVTLAVGLLLMIYYGSWLFSDHPNPKAVTIGTSYMRYWLPAFALLSPFVAEGVISISSRVAASFSLRRASPAKAGGYLLIVGMLIIFGLRESVFVGDESLIAVRENIMRHEEIRTQVFSLVPDYGIIITDRHDKFFFPTRKVVVGLHDPKTIQGLSLLFKHAPVYYYGITFSPEALAREQNKLRPYGFILKPVRYFGSESLYVLSQL